MKDLFVLTKILEILSTAARGQANAMTRDELERRLLIHCIDIGDRKTREAYAMLPICSCEKGLFIPQTPAEVAEYEKYLSRKLPAPAVALKVRRIYATWPSLVPVKPQIQHSLFPEQGA